MTVVRTAWRRLAGAALLVAPLLVGCVAVAPAERSNSHELDISSPVPQASSEIAHWVNHHGGRTVFGTPMGDLMEHERGFCQYYEGAAVCWNAIEGVWLIPLGRLGAPQVPPIEAPVEGDAVRYFPETKHAVILAFLSFFEEHGGAPVFGRPLTEFMQDGDLWVQWFENVRLEWRPDLPEGQRVKLTPLGEIWHYRSAGKLPAVELLQGPAADAPRVALELNLEMLIESPILPRGDTQRVELLLWDSAGEPVQDAVATVYVSSSAGYEILQSAPTGVQGTSVVDVGAVRGECGELVIVRAVVDMGGTLASCERQFTLWCAPEG